jgi:hypothetical protein
MEKDFVTSEQIEKARSVNLLDYLKKTEPSNLVSSAPGEYMLKDHDSLKISNNKFHWCSRGVGGNNAIDYLVKVRGIEFKEAVRELAGDSDFISRSNDNRAPPEKPKSKDDGHFFILPEAHSHNNDVISYLKGRGIEEAVINDCIKMKMLYQNTKQACVFVSFNSQGEAKYASERGIKSDFKKDVAGSNKAFAFCMPPTTGNSHSNKPAFERLYVFEGAVDCLSHASITQIGGTDWDGYRLSLGGVSSLALNTFLENNPQISTVYICLDNDKTGKESTERIAKEILEKEQYSHINIFIAPPPIGTDYNDTLMFLQEKLKERSLEFEKNTVLDAPKPQPKKKREEMLI